MPDPDRDTEPEARTDPRYDNFPVEHYDAYNEWDIQHETPADHDAVDDVAEEYADETDKTNVRWIGLAGQTKPYIYDPGGEAIYEGELDEQEERVILREANRRDVDEDRSLGEHIEEFGDRHGWEWLSSFARDHLEGDGEVDRDRTATAEPAHSPEELDLRDTEFQRRNLLDEAEADVGFFGSHTLVNEDGWVHMVEREFNVYADERGGIDVEVDEEFLVSEAESADRRAGDADIIADRRRELTVEADPDDFGWENEVAEELQRWHESNVEWPRET